MPGFPCAQPPGSPTATAYAHAVRAAAPYAR